MIWKMAFYLLTLAASALYLCQKNEKYKKQNMDKPESESNQVPAEILKDELNENDGEIITQILTDSN